MLKRQRFEQDVDLERLLVMVWRAAIAVVIAVLVLWVILAVALWLLKPDARDIKQAARLLPDVIRLAARLARDQSLSFGTRVWLWVLLGYLALPIDLIPDFIPVLGYADDAIITVLVFRMVARRAGATAIKDNWPGTDQGLATLLSLCGLKGATPP